MELLTAREAASKLRITEKAVRDMVRRGSLRAVRLSDGPRGRIRIREAELVRFVQEAEK